MNEGFLKDMAWESARIADGFNPDRIRLDACGAWIAYDDFKNRESLFGWELDHIIPVQQLKALNVPSELWDDPQNIRALHWKNNKSKGNSYPMYKAAIVGAGDTNISQRATFWVDEVLQYTLRKLFKTE